MEPKKPHVHLFGKEIQNDQPPDKTSESMREPGKRKTWNWKKEEDCCGSPKGDLVWGIIVLLAGIILLTNSLGLVAWEFWQHVWLFWPAIFILMGVSIILGRNLISRFVISILTVTICLFIIVYSLIQIGSPLLSYISPEVINFISNINFK